MEKITEAEEQVVVLSVPWIEDSKHVGKVVTLKHRETPATWATGVLPDGTTVVIQSYTPATELSKALF